MELNPVTVTASRTPQKITETGRSITVIDGALFRQLPVTSIDELLKYVPGVEMQSRGPMGAQSDIVIRGGTFQQVLVLIDGVKLNDPLSGHFSAYIPVTPDEIDRIEILRGPAAAMYGSEAVGGVINIVTKTFQRYNKEKTDHKKVGVALGEYGFVNANAGWHKTSAKVNSYLGVLSNNTSGQLLRGKNRGYIHNHTFSGSLAFALKNDWQLSLRSSYDNRRFAAQNFYTTFKSDTATEKVNTWWNQLQLKKQTTQSTKELDIIYKQTSDNYLYNSLSVANANKSSLLLIQYLYGTKINDHFRLSLGAQADNRTIRSNDRGNHGTSHGAAFGSLLYSLKKFKIVPSLRLDYDDNYGAAVLPQLNVSYQLQQITFRGTAGRAIRSADYTERYNNYGKTLVTGGSIGNPDLATENSCSYEAGADVVTGNHFKLSATAFYRDQSNVIDYVPTAYADMPRKNNLSPTGSYALAKNIKEVDTKGVELDVAFQQSFANRQSIYVNAGVTFLKSSSSDSVPSFYIISHAKKMIQANVIYTFGAFNLSANIIYKDRNPGTASAISATITKNYTVLNARLGWTVKEHVKFFLSCNNITDTKYSDLLGSIMPSRWTTGGISIDL